MPHRHQRSERKTLADASGRGDTQPGDAAVLDFPHRIAPGRQARGKRVVLRDRLALGAWSACDRIHLDLLGAARVRSSVFGRLGTQVLANPRNPDAHSRGNRHGDSRIAAQIVMRRRRHRRLDLAQHGEALLVDRRDGALIGHFGVAQRVDRAIHAFGKRRRIEIAQHRSAIVASAADQPFATREIDEKTFHRFRNLLERQAAAPRAKLRARPIDLGWA